LTFSSGTSGIAANPNHDSALVIASSDSSTKKFTGTEMNTKGWKVGDEIVIGGTACASGTKRYTISSLTSTELKTNESFAVEQNEATGGECKVYNPAKLHGGYNVIVNSADSSTNTFVGSKEWSAAGWRVGHKIWIGGKVTITGGSTNQCGTDGAAHEYTITQLSGTTLTVASSTVTEDTAGDCLVMNNPLDNFDPTSTYTIADSTGAGVPRKPAYISSWAADGSLASCAGRPGHCDDKFSDETNKFLPPCTSSVTQNCINSNASLANQAFMTPTGTCSKPEHKDRVVCAADGGTWTAAANGTCANKKTGESCRGSCSVGSHNTKTDCEGASGTWYPLYQCLNPTDEHVEFEGGAVTCNADSTVTVTPCTLKEDSIDRLKLCTSLGSAQEDPGALIRVLQVFHLFGFLWTNQLLLAISACCIAGAVCKWYWTRPRDSDKKDLGKNVILNSVKRTYRYHIGSLAAGSFIIALVQLIRLIIMYIDHKTKELQDSNALIKVMFKIVHCCLWCFEKSLKFFMKDAYIIIAMRGYSFCMAGREVVFIILDNMAQLAVATAISVWVCFLGKIILSIAAVSVCFFMINNVYSGLSDDPVSPYVPCIITIMIAYFMAAAFLQVYSLTMDTILLCFIEDKKIHANSNPKKSFYPTLLYKVLVPKDKQDEAHLDVSDSDNEKDSDSSDDSSDDGKRKKKPKGNKVAPETKKRKKDSSSEEDSDDMDVVEIL
jgi:hypothetical protein